MSDKSPLDGATPAQVAEFMRALQAGCLWISGAVVVVLAAMFVLVVVVILKTLQ